MVHIQQHLQRKTKFSFFLIFVGNILEQEKEVLVQHLAKVPIISGFFLQPLFRAVLGEVS